MRKIAFIFGTRPEAIKLCPLIVAMRKHGEFAAHVCVTGQHREMLDSVLGPFGVVPDVDLALMRPGQTLGELTSRAVAGIDAYLEAHRPDTVVVQGDTTTAFCAALCAFYRRIPVGHVEAGLRTRDRHSPFPEEINRVMIGRLADRHFAPTERARENLLGEGVPPGRVFVTGNTVIDALHLALERIKADPPDVSGLPPGLMADGRRMVLITGHRRENFGNGFRNICRAIATLAERFPSVEFVYPVHLNPNVRGPVFRILSGGRNIHLIDPLEYLPFVALMDRARIILTDSGGVQEEAPSLGKPVLVMRDTTERPEVIEMGTAKLVGTDADAVAESVSLLLTDETAYAAMANRGNPYGDGKASERILDILRSDR